MSFSLPSKFYAMVDPARGHDPVELARIYLDAGAKIMQLRLKDAAGCAMLIAARAIVAMCKKSGAMLIVNDRLDVAMLSGAAGVHLGQLDIPLEAARRVARSADIEMVIGVSTSSVELALAAEKGGADYIGFGPVFAGGLKNIAKGRGLAMLREVRDAVKIPIVAIGGITEESAPSVIEAGADAVAIITDVLDSPDIPAKIRRLVKL
jgi:thiamine-phosphate pyrophosphorylase